MSNDHTGSRRNKKRDFVKASNFNLRSIAKRSNLIDYNNQPNSGKLNGNTSVKRQPISSAKLSARNKVKSVL